MWVVSFRNDLLPGIELPIVYSWDEKLGRLQSRSRHVEEKILRPLWNRTPILRSPSLQYSVATPTEPEQLSKLMEKKIMSDLSCIKKEHNESSKN
jgi:hypothetical protein